MFVSGFAMNAAFKSKLDSISKQLDKDQKLLFEGELDALIRKYSRQIKKRSITKRKNEQFENVKQRFNEWVDNQVEQKAERAGIANLPHEEKYKELHSAGAVPRKEHRSSTKITESSSNPLADINHAITRMKKLMSKEGQKEKLRMSKDAFAEAFNLPGGGALDKELRKSLKSLSSEEWEEFNFKNKKLIASIWDWYHAQMKNLADPNFMLGKHMMPSIPAMLIENVLTQITDIKQETRTRRIATGVKLTKRLIK